MNWRIFIMLYVCMCCVCLCCEISVLTMWSINGRGSWRRSNRWALQRMWSSSWRKTWDGCQRRQESCSTWRHSLATSLTSGMWRKWARSRLSKPRVTSGKHFMKVDTERGRERERERRKPWVFVRCVVECVVFGWWHYPPHGSSPTPIIIIINIVNSGGVFFFFSFCFWC